MEVLRLVGMHLRPSLGREQLYESYSFVLFSPVMMITSCMKLGGNLPLGHDALLFSISGTG